MNQLINLQDLGIEEVATTGLEELTQASQYLPQLRIYGASSDIVKENKFPMGHLGLYYNNDKIVDLGEETDVLVIEARPKASIIMSGENPVNYYGKFVDGVWDCSNPNFQEVKAKAMAKERSHNVGLEYLLFIPVLKEFGLFHMGTSTLRRESDNMLALRYNAATVKVKFIKKKDYSWHGCTVLKCDTPFELPDGEALKAERDKFMDPVNSKVEMVEESSSQRDR